MVRHHLAIRHPLYDLLRHAIAYDASAFVCLLDLPIAAHLRRKFLLDRHALAHGAADLFHFLDRLAHRAGAAAAVRHLNRHPLAAHHFSLDFARNEGIDYAHTWFFMPLRDQGHACVLGDDLAWNQPINDALNFPLMPDRPITGDHLIDVLTARGAADATVVVAAIAMTRPASAMASLRWIGYCHQSDHCES